MDVSLKRIIVNRIGDIASLENSEFPDSVDFSVRLEKEHSTIVGGDPKLAVVRLTLDVTFPHKQV